MTCELADKQELSNIYEVVQHTIKTVYPKYYPAEVVKFFCGPSQSGRNIKRYCKR